MRQQRQKSEQRQKPEDLYPPQSEDPRISIDCRSWEEAQISYTHGFS